MKSFAKNVLVASLLLASTSALAANLVTSPGSSTGPTGNGQQSTEILSWMSFADSDLYFKNDTSGKKTIAVSVVYARENEAGIFIPKSETFVLQPDQTKLISLKGDDALVRVFAETVEGSLETPILSLNMCTFNNQYYNPTIVPGKGKSRKDITFIGGKTTPVMISYPSDKLKKDGYNKLNIENAECWADTK